MPDQTYENHTRTYPLFHLVVVPLLGINLVAHIVLLIIYPSVALGVLTMLGVTLILLALASRLMALTAQDRVIRLEERLRYRDILSPELANRAEKDLQTSQVIALRFASDDELGSLVERTLNGEFTKTKEIKLAIQNWRGDYLRV